MRSNTYSHTHNVPGGKEESVRLAIDFKALGIDPAKATLTAMPMDKLQDKAAYQISATITIPPDKGLLLTLQQWNATHENW